MASKLSQEEKSTNFETMLHIQKVNKFLNIFIRDLMTRGERHDQSKLESPEVELFTELTPLLCGVTYDSPEYKEFLTKLKPALDHHYAKNRHHPQHFPHCKSAEIEQLRADIDELEYINKREESHAIKRTIERLKEELAILESPINNMNLMDIVEMFADWKASSMRHDDGNIRKSIEINTTRYSMSPQLAKIYLNTIELLEKD